MFKIQGLLFILFYFFEIQNSGTFFFFFWENKIQGLGIDILKQQFNSRKPNFINDQMNQRDVWTYVFLNATYEFSSLICQVQQ